MITAIVPVTESKIGMITAAVATVDRVRISTQAVATAATTTALLTMGTVMMTLITDIFVIHWMSVTLILLLKAHITQLIATMSLKALVAPLTTAFLMASTLTLDNTSKTNEPSLHMAYGAGVTDIIVIGSRG
jgi:hypothetical protein